MNGEFLNEIPSDEKIKFKSVVRKEDEDNDDNDEFKL